MRDNLNLFLDKVPILQFVGEEKEISTDYKYKVDEDVQLVCKYLKAYKENRIDRLYEEGKLHSLFFSKYLFILLHEYCRLLATVCIKNVSVP